MPQTAACESGTGTLSAAAGFAVMSYLPGFAAIVALAVGACTEQAEPPPDPEAAAQVGPAEALPRALPPLGETPRYVGTWATSAEGCSVPAWTFEARAVHTQGEVSCTFNTVSMTNAGYEITASCTAEAPPAPYTIQLSFAESARAMMLSGGPWAATSLIYCGGSRNE